MSIDQTAGTAYEAVGVFNSAEALQAAIDELLSSGFDRAELSLLASQDAVERRLGHRYEKVSGLANDPTVPRAAYMSTEAIGEAEGGLIGGLLFVGAVAATGAIVASGGTLAAAIAFGALATTVSANADGSHNETNGTTRLVTPHQGPGVGSVKSPPFYDAAYLNQQAQRRSDMVFHTADNQSAYRAQQQRQGPGMWSSKAPGVR